MDTSKQALAEVRSRRRWTLEEKRRITQETLLGGTSVARIAQRYALNANQLFEWRKNLYRSAPEAPASARKGICGQSAGFR